MAGVVRNILLLFSSCMLGYIGAWLASRYGFLDMPTGRSSHEKPIPKGGGIGILGAFVFSGFAYGIPTRVMWPTIAISLLSLADDWQDLAPAFRLLMQFLAAGVLVFLSHWSWWAVLPACLFIVGTANFYNFMDGINGLAAMTGIAGFLLLGSYGVVYGMPKSYSMLCFSIALACLGFLPMNIPRARVFMGDVGSVLLGYLFAFFVLSFSRNFAEFVLLASFLFPFYADVLLCLFERLRQGHPLMQAHRSHLYQILANEYGIAHWKIALAYVIVQCSVALCSWLFIRYSLLVFFCWLAFCSFLFVAVNNRVKSKRLSINS